MTTYIGETLVHVYAGAGTVPVKFILGAGPGDLTYVDLPFITGTAYDSLTLTVDEGTVTGEAPITYSYQWMANGVPIPTLPEFLEDPELELA